jgi:hypothetical protein
MVVLIALFLGLERAELLASQGKTMVIFNNVVPTEKSNLNV